MTDTFEPILFYPNGKYQLVKPIRGNQFSLLELQSMVGGMIEIATLPTGNIMIFNENGKSLGMSENKKASRLAKKILTKEGEILDTLVGPVLYCAKSFIS